MLGLCTQYLLFELTCFPFTHNNILLSLFVFSFFFQAITDSHQLPHIGLFVGNLNLKSLQTLNVKSCPKLTYLFTVSITQSLVLLKYLTIEACDALECIIKYESKETMDVDQRSSLASIFPKLQRISIDNCGQLECFLSIDSNKREILDSTASSINLV